MVYWRYAAGAKTATGTRSPLHRSNTTQYFVDVMSGWVFGIAILLYIDKGVPGPDNICPVYKSIQPTNQPTSPSHAD